MKIVIYLYDGVTMLDAIGPYEVLRNMSGAEVYFVAETAGEVEADSSRIHVNAKYSIDEIREADVLVIPGSTISFMRQMNNPKVMQWIREMDRHTKWTVSVCTGAHLLAAAGLLNGLKATSHWMTLKLLREYGAIPISERMVEQGKYMTAAGVSAGIDMALYLSNRIAGEEEAKAIQLIIEYDPAPVFDSGSVSNASEETIRRARRKMSSEAKRGLGTLGLIKNMKKLLHLLK